MTLMFLEFSCFADEYDLSSVAKYFKFDKVPIAHLVKCLLFELFVSVCRTYASACLLRANTESVLRIVKQPCFIKRKKCIDCIGK